MAEDNLGACNFFDLREIAKKRLPKGLFECVDRGTDAVRVELRLIDPAARAVAGGRAT
jgi:hypothetical protein